MVLSLVGTSPTRSMITISEGKRTLRLFRLRGTSPDLRLRLTRTLVAIRALTSRSKATDSLACRSLQDHLPDQRGLHLARPPKGWVRDCWIQRSLSLSSRVCLPYSALSSAAAVRTLLPA